MDAIQAIAASPDTGLFQPNGLFSKLVDTALDAYAISRTGTRADAVPGTVYPSGQTNPEIVESARKVSAPTPAPSPSAQIYAYMPVILALAGVAVVGAIAYHLAKR